MAISQSAVNEAVVATASKSSEQLVTYGTGTDAPTTAPASASDGVALGTARYVNLTTRVENDTKAALVQVWALEPKGDATGALQWALLDTFWSTTAQMRHRIYVGSASRLAVSCPDAHRLPSTSGPENVVMDILRELPASPV